MLCGRGVIGFGRFGVEVVWGGLTCLLAEATSLLAFAICWISCSKATSPYPKVYTYTHQSAEVVTYPAATLDLFWNLRSRVQGLGCTYEKSCFECVRSTLQLWQQVQALDQADRKAERHSIEIFPKLRTQGSRSPCSSTSRCGAAVCQK